MLGGCLAAHPKLKGADESLFFLDLWSAYMGLYKGLNRSAWAPLSKYMTDGQLIEAMGSFADSIIGGLIGDGEFRYVDNTPWYGMIMPLICSLYPDAIFVHLIRDGRHVASSLTVSYEAGYTWAGADIRARSVLWRDAVEVTRQNALCIESGRYVEIRYEDICTNPIATLKLVLNLLDTEWSDDVLIPLAEAHATPSRSDGLLAKLNSLNVLEITPRMIPPSWPPDWSDDERRTFDEEAGNILRELGYEADNERQSCAN
jgi:hypothetical protein